MNLKDYQKKAVEDTLRHANSILRTDYPGIKNIIIDAIMGSGKTVIAARVIDDLIDTEDIYPVFIWLTPGKGNLEEQSKNKISELSVNSKCLLADELHGLDRLDPGTVVFINWEKFGKGKKINRGGDYASIDDIMNNTRQRCKVVLFVDESHVVSDSEKSIHIKQEDIKPDLTIEMSATPLIKRAQVVRVDIEDVIKEGMIKKAGIINPGIYGVEDFNDKDSLQLIMEGSIEQRGLVAKRYKERKILVNPLNPIQFPDAEKGEELINTVLDILASFGYTTANGTVAIWLSDDKDGRNRHININTISENTDRVCFLLFKQAIALGWDCPRAHVLTMLRASKSPKFKKQTLGRVYRTAERKHYNDPILDAAYIFTNLPGIVANLEDDAFTSSLNRLKDLSSVRKPSCPEFRLLSFYKYTEAKSLIKAEFYVEEKFLPSAFEEVIGMTLSKNTEDNLTNAKTCGLDVSTDYTEEVMSDTKMGMKDIRDLNVITAEKTTFLKISDKDILFTFDTKIVKPALNGFPPTKSTPTVREAIYKFFLKYFGMDEKDNGAVKIQRIVVQNADLFINSLDNAIKAYKKWKNNTEKHVEKNPTCRYNDEWTIPPDDAFSSKTYEEIKCNNYAMHPCYLLKKRSKPEHLFEEFLTLHKNIALWYKNETKAEKYLGIRYLKINGEEHPFYPDFITLNNNRVIGIWDTKGGIYASNEEAGPRSNYLQTYIRHYSTDIQPLTGGIVIIDSGIFKVFIGPKYDIKDTNNWVPIGNLL